MELGLPLSPLCDRSVTCIPESQLGTQCVQNIFPRLIRHAPPIKTEKKNSFPKWQPKTTFEN